jgi:transglutaminase-like putative cysteine protease
LAKNITKEANIDREKAKRIADWVNKNIEKRLKDKSSALDVLSSREGECEAHSMLTAALLRSIGIPAKIVGGIVYSNDYKGFLYHAWNEVWIDNHFVPLDATFGEFPAKPYHLKLTEENNMEDVIFYLGKLKIKVLDVKKTLPH